MDLNKTYTPADIEDKWYAHWENAGYFHSEPDEREPYSIVIPPPNVTGMLHMGHMLNNTIQDILIRKARLDGKNACWVPGTDHASIATEAKVVRMLREKGIKKSDLTREDFLAHAWEWKEEYGGIILKQLRKLGASCDWERTAFTMDETRSKAVIRVFIDLYKKGKIYRGHRMVNWDPEAKTVLSNEEVIYQEEETKLYHVSYPFEDGSGALIIATTRPETILGDTALAVHPQDERYKAAVGKKVIVPLAGRAIPVIADEYVDREFGTGALKITPAHDPNDYEIGQRHGLEIIDMLNADGTVAEIAGHFVGLDRHVARKKMAAWLEEAGQLVKEESYRHNVGRSERTNAVVEPRLSLQWYVDMKQLAGEALRAVEENEVLFIPEKYKNIYRHWMTNIRDWCISRQLWWGHRIPAYYLGEEEEQQVFLGETPEEALQQAKDKTGNADLTLDDLRQDEDVIDTWFSSWLWPITVFDGFENSKDFQYYYPTAVLVTGWDIIFLWVARMIMAGYEWKGEKPFREVYFTGMVRDKQRRKMSKQLGNSPDALKLIGDFGADGVRFGILSSSPAGGDLLFDEKLCEQGGKFCNKIWNALRLIKGWEKSEMETPEENTFATEWFETLLNKTITDVNASFADYRLSEAIMQLYSFVWDDFCSTYLEIVKPGQDEQIDSPTLEKTLDFYESICQLLHPFMPFITEEIWHALRQRSAGEDLIVSDFPKSGRAEKEGILQKADALKSVVSQVRDLRNRYGTPPRELLDLSYKENTFVSEMHEEKGLVEALKKWGYLGDYRPFEAGDEERVQFVSGKGQFYLAIESNTDPEEEKKRLEEELKYMEGFVASVNKKLSNQRFVENAPQDVVDRERKKLADGETRIKLLSESLRRFSEN